MSAWLLGGGLLAAGAWAGGALLMPQAALAGALAALLGAAALPLGALGWALALPLIEGRWKALGPSCRRLAGLLPWLALWLLPVLLGVSGLYPWAELDAAGFRGAWLSVPGFVGRSLGYLLLGMWLAFWLLPRLLRRPGWGAPGLILWVVLVSAAAIDWALSLDEGLHSTIFGLLYLGRCLLTALAAAGLLAALAPGVLRALLLSMLLAWSYLHAMQYLIVWAADLPREIHWYLARGDGAWAVLSWGVWLAAGLAFALLALPGGEQLRRLSWACVLVLLGGALEGAWLSLPSLPSLAPGPALVLTVLAWLAGGGLIGWGWYRGGVHGR